MRTKRPLPPRSCLLAAAASAALLGCQPGTEDNAVEANVDEEPAVNLPVALPTRSMGRAELMAAVRQAASAAAAGTDDSARQRQLDGRQFEIRIRFGCRGPANYLNRSLLGWSFEPERRTLRVRAMPTISTADPIAAAIAGEAVEAVEGFWIPRPWLLQPVCPAAAAVSGAPVKREAEAEEAEPGAPADEPAAEAPGDETVAADAEVQPSLRWPKIGIAQFFTAADPRTRRRDLRPYQSVSTLDADQPIGSQGFNLVLSGRLRALPGKGVIECLARDADTPPDCIVSAEFHRVWMEQPETKEIVAEWGSG